MSSGKTFIAPTTGSDNVLFNSSHHKNEKDVLSGFTPDKAVITDTTGTVKTSTVGSTELGYLDGVTSAIQTQLNAKQATITGAASSIDTEALTINRALISDANGKVAVSDVTSTELGYLDGVSSAIQTQLNAKQATITGGATTISSNNLTANRAVVSDAEGKIIVSDVTSTELGHLDTVSSNIQDN
jgi:Trp operon repressor